MQQITRRIKPHVLLAYEALLRRLKQQFRNHPIIQADYQKYRAGFYGETRLDYKLSLIKRNNFIHVPGTRLHNNYNYFQIDSIIVTPKVIFILEAKHMQGILEYYSNQRQLVQITDQGKTSYLDPLLQARTQAKHLVDWLENIGVTIPVEYLVVSTNPATILQNLDGDQKFNHRFITLENLPFKIDEIYQSYNKVIINQNRINSVAKKVSEKNNPLIVDLMDKYGITNNQLIHGIPCSYCSTYPLQRKNKVWLCKDCGKNDAKVHERVILDYFLLHKNSISNSQCRKLLNLPSRFATYRMLSSMKLKTNGNRNSTKYITPTLHEFPQDAAPKERTKLFQNQ